MKRKIAAFAAALLLIGVSAGVMAVIRGKESKEQAVPENDISRSDTVLQELSESEKTEFDSKCFLTVKIGQEVVTMDMENYLIGVVAAEMPAKFEFEALRAQAVAARTYTVYKMKTGCANHPEADACADINCCKAYSDTDTLRNVWGGNFDQYYERIKSAVNETDGVVVTYEKEPILAAFHSSSGGMTADSGEVWGKSLPYLASVESPESSELVPNYIVEKVISPEEFKETVAQRYPAADLSGEVGTWIEITDMSESGRVESVDIGGVSVYGSAVRNMFDLRSTMFMVEADEGGVTFTTAGYGHGVGMSQYGANILAQSGWRYDEILARYYTDTTLTKVIMD